ncbi:hypothetical protein BASA50_002349 [Batrachochytrium salamandrivorans]|uniref:Ubinuclein middle domain-containing protein n=1 Tax=Batrachochytrium salamandrivorans TaxID=1357716 RepID=A0ABQ8FP90_9FUNG|nr:hypothetical protein BASA50_002349 [Batrachochytrium salamandrivorans]
MRLISLVLISFIATNTVAIYTPKMHQIEKRGLPLPAENNSNEPHLPAENNSNEPPLLAENNSDEPPLPADNNSNEPSSSQPNPADANEQSESSQSTSFTSRMFSHITGLLARIRDFYMDGEYSNIIGTTNGRWKYPTPDPFLLEKEIVERIKLLKEAVEKATREEEQEVKDQAKKSQATSDESTTDSSSKNGLDESENDPELPIESFQEASSSLTGRTYQKYMEELWDIKSLVEQVVKSVIRIKKADYTSGYNMIQKAAIKRSRDYLQELTNIGECMMKAWGTMPKAFTFKNRDGLLESLLEVDEFKTVGENALIWDPDNPKKGRKGRKDLVTSKEILDAKDYSFHNSAISEDGDYCYDCYEYYRDDEEEEEEKDEEDEEEEEKDEEEEEDDEKEESKNTKNTKTRNKMIKIELFMSNLIRSKNS